MNLADALLSQTHAAGTVIVRQGDAGDGMYFVEDGEVDVTMVGDDVEKHVTSLRQVCALTSQLCPDQKLTFCRGNRQVAYNLLLMSVHDIPHWPRLDQK